MSRLLLLLSFSTLWLLALPMSFVADFVMELVRSVAKNFYWLFWQMSLLAPKSLFVYNLPLSLSYRSSFVAECERWVVKLMEG